MRKSSWIWIVAGWFFIVRVSEYYTLRTDMGRGLTWADALRYTLVELGFWIIITPVIAWWARIFPLERPALLKNAAVLLALNVFTEILYSSYRVKLHHFVYPDFPLRSFWRQSQTAAACCARTMKAQTGWKVRVSPCTTPPEKFGIRAG